MMSTSLLMRLIRPSYLCTVHELHISTRDKGGLRRTLAKASQLLLLYNHCIFIVYLCDLHQSRANDPNFHILSLYLVMMGYLFHKMQINQCYSCESSVCCVTVGQ